MIYSVEHKPLPRADNLLTETEALPPGTYYAATGSPEQRLLANSLALQQGDSRSEQLAACILAHIESRLPCRIRQLTVYASENAVVLSGECSTYYTKQIAQHAAMGVLEYERLINNIDVRQTK